VEAAASILAGSALTAGGGAIAASPKHAWSLVSKWACLSGVVGVVGVGVVVAFTAARGGHHAATLRSPLPERAGYGVASSSSAAHAASLSPVQAKTASVPAAPPVVDVNDLPVAPAPSVTSAPARAATVATAAIDTARPPGRAPLTLELAILDRARAALASGDATRALSALDEHAARFPRGTLSAEAAVLRIEAVARTGDTDTARRLAHAFLADHAASPYAARVSTWLATDLSNNP
jgi:TolA-binding protein